MRFRRYEFGGIFWGLRSEPGELPALFRPDRWETCLDQIVAGEARGLLTFRYCIQKLRRRRRQINDILNPAFGRALSLRNLGEGFAFYDHRQPAPGFDDIPDQSLIDLGRRVAQMQFQFHTAAADAEWCFDGQSVRIDLIWMAVGELSHCSTVQQEREQTVLQILLSIQGPDLISAALDDLEAADLGIDEKEEVDLAGAEWEALPPKRQFVLIRRKLRHLAEELFDASALPNADEDQEGGAEFEDLAGSGAIGSFGRSIAKASKLEQTYDELFSKMQSLRNIISSDPEIEEVASPIDHVSLGSLQKILTEGEVLVTVFPRLPVTESDSEPETSHMLVIPKSGKARIVDCPPPGAGVPGASAMVDGFDRFCKEMERVRGVRHGPNAEGPLALEGIDPREPVQDLPIDGEFASFWHEFDDLISTMIWEPLR